MAVLMEANTKGASYGLSPHVVQAWRSINDDRNVYIAAGKTWDWEIGNFPNVPGASVRLRYLKR